MRFATILSASILLTACGSGDREPNQSTSPERPRHDNFAGHPDSIRSLANQIEKIPPRVSIEEFQSALEETGLVEIPYGHFKDLEYYWTIKTPDEDPPSYLLTGMFNFSPDQRSLVLARITAIDGAGNRTKTIWALEHAHAGTTPTDPERGGDE